MFALINPGTGSIGGTHKRALANVRAFRDEIGLDDPKPNLVDPEGPARRCDDGRYSFTIERGIRSIGVDIPGCELEVLKDRGFAPRLYIDGSSWTWDIALSQARFYLDDPDGSMEKAYKRSEKACDRELDKNPTCSVCGAWREKKLDGDRHFSPYVIVCYGCTVETQLMNREGAVLMTPMYEYERGREVLIARRMPVAPNSCMRGYYWGRWACRLEQAHAGECKRIWEPTGERWSPPKEGASK